MNIVTRMTLCSICLLLGLGVKYKVYGRQQEDRGTSATNAREFKPVTDQMLLNPSPDDWLSWRRTDDSWGYSPLSQINRKNVNQLRMVWGWAMRTGAQETTPIVHDGVMYLANPSDVIDALDAESGDLLWEYRRQLPTDSTPKMNVVRNISIYDDKIYVNTLDVHVVALDARTGNVVWDTKIADPKEGFWYGAGPLIVRGKVISGLEGCENFHEDKCSITALDAETGKELWRRSTIAKPGEAGGDSWGDVPLMFRAGGDMWTTGSYDPDLNLIYWPVTQAKPWARAARGTDGAALYTDSTLALDPDTGKIVWYHQYLPGESHDMDDNFENILIDIGGQKHLFEMGKLGVLWDIDRRTGKFVHATDLGYQNIVDVDTETGAVTYRPGKLPVLDQPVDICPSVAGVKSWRSMAYQPETRAFYVPIELSCERATYTNVEKVEGRGGEGLGPRVNMPNPTSDGNLGEFMALDTTGRILWKHRQRAPFNTAALTTAGGLVFIGDWNRYIDAYDVKTGSLLWQTRTVTSPEGFPITYAVHGKQYIAVPIGVGAESWAAAIPQELSPDIKRPTSGNAIVVYALP